MKQLTAGGYNEANELEKLKEKRMNRTNWTVPEHEKMVC